MRVAKNPLKFGQIRSLILQHLRSSLSPGQKLMILAGHYRKKTANNACNPSQSEKNNCLKSIYLSTVAHLDTIVIFPIENLYPFSSQWHLISPCSEEQLKS